MDLETVGAFIDDSPSEVYANEVIFGVKLRKFSNWHRLLLNTAQSPFTSKGIVTMRDLRVAVGICRLRAFNSRVHKPWLVPTFLYIRAILTRKPLHGALKKRVDLFLKYSSSYLQDPPHTIIPPKRGKSYVPDTPRGRFDDCIEMVGDLITWGIEERRAWEMPIGQARVYRILARRAAGLDVDIMTEEEKKFQDDMRKALNQKKTKTHGRR